MINARITGEHFTMGSTHYPVGSIVRVSRPAFDYMVKNGDAVDADADPGDVTQDPVVEPDVGTYARRDMQAQNAPKPNPQVRKKRSVRKKTATKRTDA